MNSFLDSCKMSKPEEHKISSTMRKPQNGLDGGRSNSKTQSITGYLKESLQKSTPGKNSSTVTADSKGSPITKVNICGEDGPGKRDPLGGKKTWYINKFGKPYCVVETEPPSLIKSVKHT